MVRLSSFAILSQSVEGDYRVLMNGCTGALDLIPTQLASLFEQIRDEAPHGMAYFQEELLHPETLDSLMEGGHITRLDHFQEKSLVGEIARGLHEKGTRVPHFMIVPNLDCNYRCTYCFERHLQIDIQSPQGILGRSPEKVVMSPDMPPLIYDCIENIQSRAGREPGGMVILYGGEPLDGRHRDLVFGLVRQGMARGYWFSVVTNGHDLDQFLPLVGGDGLKQIQVSIDGPKRSHDRRRIYQGRGSSYDSIMSNVRRALTRDGVEIHIRVNVDPDNVALFEEALANFEREGWTNHDGVTIYANTVYDKDREGKVDTRVGVAQLAWRLFEISGNYRNVFTSAPAAHIASALYPALDSGERFGLTGVYCSANCGNYIFSPDGHIYACWESLGKDDARIGSYLGEAGLNLQEDRLERWFTRSVAEVEGCLECEFALVCGGGCAQYARYNQGSFQKPYCNDFQKIFPMALLDEIARQPQFAGFNLMPA